MNERLIEAQFSLALFLHGPAAALRPHEAFMITMAKVLASPELMHPKPDPRTVLSHDSLALGHVRRNLALAQRTIRAAWRFHARGSRR